MKKLERILIAHNEYQQQGGEDAVVRNEAQLLKSRGHQVDLYIRSNRELLGLTHAIAAAWNLNYSARARDAFGKELDRLKPDVVHVHNFFPLLTPSIYDACQARSIPVIQTLHNFRVACANALFLRQGKPCEDCLGRSPYQSVLHGCYRNSRIATLPVARMIDFHRNTGTWRSKVARFIACSEFSKGKFIQAGIPESKVVVKPNFIFGPEQAQVRHAPSHSRPTALFVGRLSPEKGIRPLLDAWKGLDIDLRIAGDGPMLNAIKAAANPRITTLGHVSDTETLWREMSTCIFLVIPSQCYENFPLALLEGYANGIPAIGSRIGCLVDLIEEKRTGLLFESGNSLDLREKATFLAINPDLAREMGRNAKRVFQEKYGAESNYDALYGIYKAALGGTVCG